MEKHKNMVHPWILYQKNKTDELITLMCKHIVVCKAKSAVEAILGLMGIYYSVCLEYPSQCTGALLYVQKEVLGDVLHKKDEAVLKKAANDLQLFVEEEDTELF